MRPSLVYCRLAARVRLPAYSRDRPSKPHFPPAIWLEKGCEKTKIKSYGESWLGEKKESMSLEFVSKELTFRLLFLVPCGQFRPSVQPHLRRAPCKFGFLSWHERKGEERRFKTRGVGFQCYTVDDVSEEGGFRVDDMSGPMRISELKLSTKL